MPRRSITSAAASSAMVRALRTVFSSCLRSAEASVVMSGGRQNRPIVEERFDRVADLADPGVEVGFAPDDPARQRDRLGFRLQLKGGIAQRSIDAGRQGERHIAPLREAAGG